jgi:Zn finger protein HypA/HybF involved in hydrogenase expression
MYCRNCLEKGKEVNMEVKLEEKAYICPRCKTRVNWGGEDGEN